MNLIQHITDVHHIIAALPAMAIFPCPIPYWRELSLKVALLCDPDVPVQTIALADGESFCCNQFVDDIDGWAGHTYLRRKGKQIFAGCKRNRYHNGSESGQALFVDGMAVGANSEVLCKRGAKIIQRKCYDHPEKIVMYKVSLK